MKKSFFTFIVLFLPWVFLGQESIEITGSVLEADTGMPLLGVNIMEKGTNKGTMTDFDGNFTIEVPQDAILEVSYIGYATKKIEVNGRSQIDIVLEQDAEALDEVIVVGYGTQKKSQVTSAVSTIKAEDLKDVTTPDVTGMLQGKAAGVQVINAGGRPGEAPTINIRGLASINGSTDPLWVVDGVIVHGTPNINPNEVASISVLKDASATALYGSRGANGVVVVTTRSGTKGETTFSVNSKSGMSQFNNGNFEVMNSQQLYDYYQHFGNPERIPENITQNLTNRNFDWIDNGTQAGLIQDHNISVTGGGEKTKIFLSLGYYNETGSVKGYEYDRLSLRLNLDYDINDRLTLKPKISANYTTTDDRQHDLRELYTLLPWDSPYNEDGNLVNPQDSGIEWFGREQRNYLYDLQWNYGKENAFNLISSFDFEYKITSKFTFVSTNNATLYYKKGEDYTDPKSNSGLAISGAIQQSYANRITTFTNQMLRFSDEFGDHSLDALIAYEYNDYQFESTGARGTGIISGSEILDTTANPDRVFGTKNEYALQSVLSNWDYSYDDRYLAQFSIRYDGASNFGEENKYGMFFSLSGGWNIYKESFFQSEIFNQLKLRASYGSVGNRPNSLYPQYALYDINNSYTGDPAAIPSQLGNPDLAWEKSYQTNIAIDGRIYDRFTFTFEYYDKNTSDLLYFVSLPSVTGYTGYWENIGGVRNKGFETVLGADIFKPETDFSWNIDFNIGFNTNEVTELFEGQEIDRGTKITRIGKDFNSWYMRKWLGVDPENGNPLWEVVDPKTGERNDTSNYNEATKQIVGTSSPDFYGGFNSNMEYKNFSLGINFSFVSGGEIFNYSRTHYDSDGAYPTYNQQVLPNGSSRWQEPGDIASHPLPLYGGNNDSNKTSSRYLENASYLRLRNLRFGYDFSKDLLDQLNVKRAQLYISADNILTLTDFSGTDPEVGAGGTYTHLYPTSSKVVLGLNLSF